MAEPWEKRITWEEFLRDKEMTENIPRKVLEHLDDDYSPFFSGTYKTFDEWYENFKSLVEA